MEEQQARLEAIEQKIKEMVIQKGIKLRRHDWGLRVERGQYVQEKEQCAVCLLGAVILGEKKSANNMVSDAAHVLGVSDLEVVQIMGGFDLPVLKTKPQVGNRPFVALGLNLANWAYSEGILENLW